jgi:nucleotidyltransferase/DNA polymerase involved in DNA repair
MALAYAPRIQSKTSSSPHNRWHQNVDLVPSPPTRQQEVAIPRTCAVFLPGFPAWAAARLQPELANKPFVVAWRGDLVALSPQAHALGIEQTWSLARLRSLHPEVQIQPQHPAQESVAWEQVLSHLVRLSPYVESIRPGLALLDLPHPEDIKPLLKYLSAQGGAAFDRSSAELAAHCAQRGELLPIKAGGLLSFLNRVPLAAMAPLGVSAQTLERLGWFGWRSLGDLRYLNRQQLESQFPEGALIYRYVQGQDTRPIPFYQPPARLTARLSFEEPACEPMEWDGALECLLTDLVAVLDQRKSYGLTLRLDTTAGRRQKRTFQRQPTNSLRTLMAASQRLMLSLLEDGAKVNSIRIVLSGLLIPRPTQGSLFEAGREALNAELTETLRSIEARYPGMVRRATVNLPESYLPEERFTWESLAERDLKEQTKTTPKGKGVMR